MSKIYLHSCRAALIRLALLIFVRGFVWKQSDSSTKFVIHPNISLKVDLRQFVSSDLSLQSASPSHFQFMWTHSPLPHWNSPTGQRGFCGSVLRLQRSMDSSDLSLQSGSPSQLHRAGIHSESLQRNSCCPQVGAVHFSSSLASPQSSSPSHTRPGDKHLPLRHWKSLEGQALASVDM